MSGGIEEFTTIAPGEGMFGRCRSGGAAVLSPFSLVVETARSGTLLRRTFFRLVIQG
jgi:hypothetical protein